MIAHAKIRDRLEWDLPAVSLFIGPKSVGKWTMAEHLVSYHRINTLNVLRIEHLDASAAHSLSLLAGLSPVGPLTLAIVRLDGSTPETKTILLKTLEECSNPNRVRFILIASDYVPETISSRSTVFRFSLLSEEEVRLVLVARGWSVDQATLYAPRGRGQVGAATTAATADWFDAKTTVGAALSAILTRDEEILFRLADKWTEAHTTLMETMCREALSRRWQAFSESECEGLVRKLALRILFALRADVRPRLIVRASLMSVLRSL